MTHSNIIVIGSGGHASVVCDSLILMGRKPLFCTDSSEQRWGAHVLDVLVKGSDDQIAIFDSKDILLANGIASVKNTDTRRRIFEDWTRKGFRFVSIQHPSAVVGSQVGRGQGVQLFAGAIVQPSARLGDNVIVNTHATVEHDCVIGDHCHIAPGATISGFAQLAFGVHVGTNATIIQRIHIGANSTIAAGAVVVCDVPENSLVIGVPGVIRSKTD